MEWTGRGARAFAFAVVMLLLSVVAVALRFISRGRILRVWGLSDWFIALTLLFSLGNTICVGLHLDHGLGQHMTDLSLEEQMAFFEILYAFALVCTISIILTKVSVLTLFLDIFAITWIRKAAYVVLVLVALDGLWLIISNILFCIPPQAYWDLAMPGRRCMDRPTKSFVDAGLNLALDLTIFCLPIPVIKSLALHPRQKLWLYFVFALGFLVCLVSVIRFPFLQFAFGSKDASWMTVDTVYWSAIEINVPIVIACIPTLRPLAATFCPRLLSASRIHASLDDGAYPPTISSPPHRLPSQSMDEV